MTISLTTATLIRPFSKRIKIFQPLIKKINENLPEEVMKIDTIRALSIILTTDNESDSLDKEKPYDGFLQLAVRVDGNDFLKHNELDQRRIIIRIIKDVIEKVAHKYGMEYSFYEKAIAKVESKII